MYIKSPTSNRRLCTTACGKRLHVMMVRVLHLHCHKRTEVPKFASAAPAGIERLRW